VVDQVVEVEDLLLQVEVQEIVLQLVLLKGTQVEIVVLLQWELVEEQLQQVNLDQEQVMVE
jgi:hypothetical protein